MQNEEKKVQNSTEASNDGNGTKPVLAVVYRLSNSDKEKIVKIPKNARLFALPFQFRTPQAINYICGYAQCFISN